MASPRARPAIGLWNVEGLSSLSSLFPLENEIVGPATELENSTCAPLSIVSVPLPEIAPPRNAAVPLREKAELNCANAPRAKLNVPLIAPPPERASVPAWMLTVPVLLNAVEIVEVAAL